MKDPNLKNSELFSVKYLARLAKILIGQSTCSSYLKQLCSFEKWLVLSNLHYLSSFTWLDFVYKSKQWPISKNISQLQITHLSSKKTSPVPKISEISLLGVLRNIFAEKCGFCWAFFVRRKYVLFAKFKGLYY